MPRSQSHPNASVSSPRARPNPVPPPPTASAAASAPAVPGHEPGEIPPVPLFSLPPIGVFAQNADKAVIDTATTIASVPGITVAPAVCDGSSLLTNGGNTVLYGDGAGLYENSATGDTTTIYTGGAGNYSNSKTGASISSSPLSSPRSRA